MRCIVFICVLSSIVIIEAWKFVETDVNVDQKFQADLRKGKGICDKKKFPAKKRKKLSSEATKGENAIFFASHLEDVPAKEYQCHELEVHFVKTLKAVRKRNIYSCKTYTKDKYYFGDGLTRDQVAVYQLPGDGKKIVFIGYMDDVDLDAFGNTLA